MNRINILIILSALIPVLNTFGAAHGGSGREEAVSARTVTATGVRMLTSKEIEDAFGKTKDALQSMYSSPKTKTTAAANLIQIATAQGQYADVPPFVQLQTIKVLSLSPIFYKEPITEAQRRTIQDSLRSILGASTSPTKDRAEIAMSLLLPKIVPDTVKGICKDALSGFVTTPAAGTPLELRSVIIAALQKIPGVDVTAPLALLAHDEEEARAARIRAEEEARAARIREEEARIAHLREQEAVLALIEYTESDGIPLPEEHKDFLVPVIKAANDGNLYDSGPLSEWNLMYKSGLSDYQQGKFRTCIRKVDQLRSDARYKTLRAKITFAERPGSTIELGAGTAIRITGACLVKEGGFLDIDKMHALQMAKTKEEVEAIILETDGTPIVTWFGS